MGKSFAIELAKRKINLILVSLPSENLDLLCIEIQTRFGVKALYYETDLTVKENILNLTKRINIQFDVKFLINNAGIGGTRKFEEASVNYIDNIIQLNVMATSLLTHQLLPNLQQQDKAYVLNISSLAAFSPIGYKTVYPASKAFVHSFSMGLNEELKGSNVSVSVVNPGPMKTNPEIIRRIEKQGFFAKITLLNPDKVARYCLNRLEKGETLIKVNQLSLVFLKVLPVWLKLPLLTNKIKKELSIAQ